MGLFLSALSLASHIPFQVRVPLTFPKAFDSVTCNSFQVCYVQQLSIPLRATAFKFATSNSFRFRYVQQLSSALRPTAFDFVTCDSFQVRYIEQLQVIFSVYEPLPNYFCFDTRSVVLPLRKFVRSLYILSQLDNAHSIYFTNDL